MIIPFISGFNEFKQIISVASSWLVNNILLLSLHGEGEGQSEEPQSGGESSISIFILIKKIDLLYLFYFPFFWNCKKNPIFKNIINSKNRKIL